MLKKWLPDSPAETVAAVPDAESVDAGDELLDTAVLGRIQALQRPGKPPILQRVIRLYLESAPQLMETIRIALADGNAQALGDPAHSLKSSSANLGATALFELCRQMEAAGRENLLDDAETLLEQLDSSYRKTLRALRKHLPEAENP